MFQSVLLILLSSWCRCLGLCLLLWEKKGAVGPEGSSVKANRTWGAHSSAWQAALCASMATSLLLVWDLRGLRFSSAGSPRELRRVRWAWCVKAQRATLLAGAPFGSFPGADTSAGRTFTFAKRKEGNAVPLFSGFKTVSPPQNWGR